MEPPSVYCPSQTYPISLFDAITKGDLKLMKNMLPKRSIQLPTQPDGCNVLHIAMKANKLDIAKLIIERLPGLVFQTNVRCETPLFHASSSAGLQLLLENGANPNARDFKDKNVLMNAVNNENIDSINCLLSVSKMRAIINTQTIPMYGGQSPLHMATYRYKSSLIVQILLTNGADRTLKDNNGMTAFDLAKFMRDSYHHTMGSLMPGPQPSLHDGSLQNKKKKPAKQQS